MTSNELMESFGWKLKLTDEGPFNDPERRAFYSRGNYGIIIDRAHIYKDIDYGILWVRDLAEHMAILGSNDTFLHLSFPWLGEATLHALNTLLPIYVAETQEPTQA